MPVPSHVRLDARLWDQTPVVVTTTAAWQKIPVRATVDGVRSGAAIRAYNRGAPLARAGAGEAYLTAVVDRRRRYLRDETGSATWAFLREKVRDLDGEATSN